MSGTMPQVHPGMVVDADMRELAHAAGVIEEFTRQYNTKALIRPVIRATHSVFAHRFDKYISNIALTQKDKFHHVYEYSPTGDPYAWIGIDQFKLWKHKITFRSGESANFTWTWRAARHPVPTYNQRRTSTVGFDGIRSLNQGDFQKLVERSSGRRYRFFWKAPMLEYGLPRMIFPKREFIVMPNGGRLNFGRGAIVTTQHPGKVEGMFTGVWLSFWTTSVENDFDRMLGDQITRDAQKRINEAIAAGKSTPRNRQRRFSFTSATEMESARKRGIDRGREAVSKHASRINAMAEHEVENFG